MQCENEVGIFHNIFASKPLHVFIPTFNVVSFLCCSVNAVNLASYVLAVVRVVWWQKIAWKDWSSSL